MNKLKRQKTMVADNKEGQYCVNHGIYDIEDSGPDIDFWRKYELDKQKEFNLWESQFQSLNFGYEQNDL